MDVLSKEVEDRLFSLPVEERARLADRLLVSLSPEIDTQWFPKLDAEMAARREARKNGGIEVRDGNAALAGLWDSFQQ